MKLNNRIDSKSFRAAMRFAIATAATFFLAGTIFAAKTARVFIDSEASTTYNEVKENDGGAKYETYVFIKGNFYVGDFDDKSLRTASFEEVAATLAENMKQRNFYPSSSPSEGDLLIVVHYGTTSVEPDLEELFMLDSTDPYAQGESDDTGYSEVYSDDFVDLADLNDLDANNTAQHRQTMRNNSLGITKALNRRNITTTEEFDLRVEMQDERYFIILMAYDYEKLRSENERELLWTTRFSVPSIGTNFEDAYPALARAASSYYGTSLEKYAKTNTHFGTGNVEIGTLETVAVEEDASPNQSSSKKQLNR
ncbi:hypothetical protein [Candidatus Pelagisphaera phototrophica]|uniref:hypothetical protein n=1 Tax=Candidatus Pelagisphaera phototrophica TaxID=2684113 RepID=UPI0019F99B74|nr:hypothetical protein [Candidatus Pelagisphaera phototrophica]QXD31306.1 hypothetical protein GA004_13340 [Candidatus Pelagisphaera phototrophica]